MLIKTLAGIGLFAAAGAAVGYSQILCAGGECQITGTPYGGAFFGGILGLAVMSGINSKPIQPIESSTGDEPSDEELSDEGPEESDKA